MYDFKAIYQASTLNDALSLRREHPDALVLAGGSDILIKTREGKLAGCEVISIYRLDELRGVSLSKDGTLRIGALTSFSHVAEDPLILAHVPVLAEAVLQVGGPQVRNIGTIGGNICNGVTSADSASTLLALDAVLVLASGAGERRVPIAEFYKGPGKVDVRAGELLTHIELSRASYSGFHGEYIKYSMRAAMDIATLGVSVNCRLSEDGMQFECARIALGVAGPVPMRCHNAEAILAGKPLVSNAAPAQTAAATAPIAAPIINPELLTEFARAVVNEIHPRTSWRASREFRLQLAGELSQRALIEAVNRAYSARAKEA